jgi:hypothetical protein
VFKLIKHLPGGAHPQPGGGAASRVRARGRFHHTKASSSLLRLRLSVVIVLSCFHCFRLFAQRPAGMKDVSSAASRFVSSKRRNLVRCVVARRQGDRADCGIGADLQQAGGLRTQAAAAETSRPECGPGGGGAMKAARRKQLLRV